jgi:CDP-diacylglycerol--glycerol-3-phosphate 3-phosphatidyltransferase
MANLITLFRIPLLAIIAYLLYQPQESLHILAAVLIIFLILMDTMDGIIARKLQTTSVLGSVLDIAADRAVELVLWVIFADLKLIPIYIPLIVITRGVFVDAIRSVAPSKGLAPFDMIQSRLGKFIVKSPWLRSPYGIAKAIAFFLLALFSGLVTTAPGTARRIFILSQYAVGIAFTLCIIRGLPVLIEGSQTLTKS